MLWFGFPTVLKIEWPNFIVITWNEITLLGSMENCLPSWNPYCQAASGAFPLGFLESLLWYPRFRGVLMPSRQFHEKAGNKGGVKRYNLHRFLLFLPTFCVWHKWLLIMESSGTAFFDTDDVQRRGLIWKILGDSVLQLPKPEWKLKTLIFFTMSRKI